MIEETTGGIVGDLALTQLGLMMGGLGLVLVGIAVLFNFLFGNTAEDFQEAKNHGKQVVCHGLFKDFTVSADKYKIVDNQVVIIRLLKNKKFNIADCDIK